MRLVGILARYSTDNQDADSIEVQVERCNRYCSEHYDMTVIDVYADFAVSGMKDSRPQYERMMADVRRGRINTVIIYDQSRMFRKMTAWFQFREELTALGASVISVTQPMIGGDLDDPANFVSEATMAIFNQVWVLQTKQKVVAKLRYMAQHGQHTGGMPPLGYVVQEQDGEKRLAVCEHEAEIVRRIFAEYDAGKSYRQIIEGLNADGIRTKKGNAFGTNSLHDLLKNKRYIGTLVYGGMSYQKDGSRSRRKEAPGAVVIENAVPAIVDRDLFDRVQAKMERRKQHPEGRAPSVRDYPLKGKVFCGECGAPLYVATALETYHYYKCSAKKRTHQCTLKQIRVDALEQMVASYVKDMFGDVDIRDEAMAALWKDAGTLKTTAADRLLKLKNEMWETEAQINRIVDAIARGAFSDALSDRLRTLEQQKKSIDDRMEELRRTAQAAQLPREKMVEIFDRIINASTEDTAAILSIVSRVEVFNDSIRVYTFFDDDPKKHRIPGDIFESEDAKVLYKSDASLLVRHDFYKIDAVVLHPLGILSVLQR